MTRTMATIMMMTMATRMMITTTRGMIMLPVVEEEELWSVATSSLTDGNLVGGFWVSVGFSASENTDYGRLLQWCVCVCVHVRVCVCVCVFD